MSGPPKTPREVKRRRGTLRKDRDPESGNLVVLPPTEDADQVPVYVDGSAMLQQALNAGANRWVGPTDWPTAELARQLWDDREQARARYADGGRRADLDALIEFTKRLQACLSQLGLDPAARAKLGVAEVKTASKLEELRDRRAARVAKAGRRAT